MLLHDLAVAMGLSSSEYCLLTSSVVRGRIRLASLLGLLAVVIVVWAKRR
jgi:hypothetical protein